MRTTEEKVRPSGPGPSLVHEDVTDIPLSATQLAALAGAEAKDISYWGREGYLKRADICGETGEEARGDGRSHSLSQLPKAKLMTLFAKRLQMKAGRASELADELLEKYGVEDAEFEATVGIAEMLERKFTAFVGLILKAELVPVFKALLKEDP